MSNGWTPERKEKQRKAIYTWRPWEKSTGPKTADGKAVVARNAMKGGHRSRRLEAEMKAIRRLLEDLAL